MDYHESRDVIIGEEITQDQGSNIVAKGYVASFDKDTKILKYYQDRSLCFGNKLDQTQSLDTKNIIPFNSPTKIRNLFLLCTSGGSAPIDQL